jgi:hypothetical protein
MGEISDQRNRYSFDQMEGMGNWRELQNVLRLTLYNVSTLLNYDAGFSLSLEELRTCANSSITLTDYKSTKPLLLVL